MPAKKAVKKPAGKGKKAVPAKKTKATKNAPSAEIKSCSFCGKKSDQSRLLIAAPNGVYICEECVSACVKIIGEETGGNICPLLTPKTSLVLEKIGSELDVPPPHRTRVKYDVLYLSAANPLSDKAYSANILPAALKQKLKVKHFSEILNSKLSFDKELLDIWGASFIIADVSGQNPDVMYFLGMLHLIGKPLILLAQKPADLPKGMVNEKNFIYKNDEKSLKDLTAVIQPVFQAIKKIKRLTKAKARKKQ